MKDSHKLILLEVREQSSQRLTSLVKQALNDAYTAMVESSEPAQGQDAQFLGREIQRVAEGFARELVGGFDALLGQVNNVSAGPGYSGLSLMDEEELESTIALEGMITHARNCDITEYLRFTTRLNELFSCRVIDESNNPLDPAQIGEAIKAGVEPVGLSSKGQLIVYRQFNKAVFHQLESVLADANRLLVEKGVLPKLEVCGRNKEEIRTRRCNSRDRVDPDERAFSTPNALAPVSASNQRDVFTLLQSLMHNDVHKVATSSHIHDSIEAIDLLFRAIWEDATVPEAIRKLLGRMSISILKTALNDKKFWDDPSHPVRALLNELADARSNACLTAGIEDDPMYQKARDLVVAFITNYEDDPEVAGMLLSELNEFKQQHAQSPEKSTISDAMNGSTLCNKRLQEAQTAANRKISERMQNENLPACIQRLLERHFRNFLVEVILAQGTGGDSWKPIMKTIDLLIWSVRPGKDEAHREKLRKLNPKLLTNIEKALRIVKVDKAYADTILREVQEAQQNSFGEADTAAGAIRPVGLPIDELARQDTVSHQAISQPESDVPVDERFLQEAASLPLGIWMEFVVDGEHTIRCTLAAKMTEPDCYVFVNRQGVKVIEKPVAGVARELEANTARQITESVLVDRAIDMVIAKLRARNERPARLIPGLDSAA